MIEELQRLQRFAADRDLSVRTSVTREGEAIGYVTIHVVSIISSNVHIERVVDAVSLESVDEAARALIAKLHMLGCEL